MVYDNRYKINEPRTTEVYTDAAAMKKHEERQSQHERLQEYGMLGSSNVKIVRAANNKGGGKPMNPSAH